MSYAYLGLLLLLSTIWGASFLLIKIGVAEMGPLTLPMVRVLIGSLTLLAILRARGERLPTQRNLWTRFAVMGLFGAVVPFTAIAWGTQFIASGLSAILNATTPLFTCMLAVALGSERLSLGRALGLLCGFCGIVVLTWPQLRGGVRATLWGQLAVIVGSISYAVSAVYARRKLLGQPSMVAALGQVSTGWLLFLPLALTERPWAMRPSAAGIIAVLILGILGTGVAYIIYYRLIQGVGATGASLVTYVVPVFGIFWGWAILGERLGWNAVAALAIILASVVLVNRPGAARGARLASAAGAE